MIVSNTKDFIKLKNQTIASYAIQYNINQCFNFHNIQQIISKHQFYYKGLNEINQVYELMLIDSAFAELLGKLAQEVFLKKVKTLREFLSLHDQSSILKGYTDSIYYQIKFEGWLMQLFFPDKDLIQIKHSKMQFSANTRSVYVLKNDICELEYFSIFESKQLFEILFDFMQLRIDLKKSKIEKETLTLILNIVFD